MAQKNKSYLEKRYLVKKKKRKQKIHKGIGYLNDTDSPPTEFPTIYPFEKYPKHREVI